MLSDASPAFLFDMDGVLIDSRELHWRSWQMLQQENQQVQFGYDTFVENFGMTNEGFLKKIMPGSEVSQRGEIGERKESIFREISASIIPLLPGMEQFLNQVQAKGVHRIIASSAPSANLHFILKHTILNRYFDSFVSGDQVPYGKPAPDIFLKAALELGYEPHDCIVLEDSTAGLTAGFTAGSFVVALATTHPIAELSPRHLLYPSPADLNYEEIVAAWKKWKNAL